MIPVCATCGTPIVRGAYLPWTHAVSYRGRGHYAKPKPGTYVSPLRREPDSPSVGLSAERLTALSPATE